MATFQHQHQQQFGPQDLGNGGDPPHDDRSQVPHRGHYTERFKMSLSAMRDAGIRAHHTLCLHCGRPASPGHRKNWRNCKGDCPINQEHNSPDHRHDGKLCPDLLRVANAEWCYAHTGDDLLAAREAVRDPVATRRNRDCREARHAASSRPTDRASGPLEPSRGPVRQPGYLASGDSNFGAEQMRSGGYDQPHEYGNNGY
jgi:hypothetical protein